MMHALDTRTSGKPWPVVCSHVCTTYGVLTVVTLAAALPPTLTPQAHTVLRGKRDVRQDVFVRCRIRLRLHSIHGC